MGKLKYVDGIRAAFDYVLSNYPESLVVGQGLWSPFYVGSSMADLEKKYGRERVIDTPVSENTSTGIVLGAALSGMKATVVHPRMDFMVLAADQIVNQASKWRSMLGSSAPIPVTIRGIINRGGEQGAQHSQALHSWFAHIPGLRVVMPACPSDARDLLISSILCNDPVLYIDDRWCYDLSEEVSPIKEQNLLHVKPLIVKEGKDITLVGAGYMTSICMNAHNELLKDHSISSEVIDLRVINPLNIDPILESVEKTKCLLVVDGSWKNCGLAGEVIASVMESIDYQLKTPPQRLTLFDSPAPTSKALEDIYYVKKADVVSKVLKMVK